MSNLKQAAEQLLARRYAGCKEGALSEELRPASLDDALAIHQQMAELKPVAGWKCLLPPAENQVVAAPIFADSIFSGEQCEFLADDGKALVEPEFAFVLGSDLSKKDGGYSEQEVFEAISSTHMALELMQRRYAADADVEFADKLADCLVNQGMFIGPKVDKQTAFSASNVNIKVSQAEQVQTFDGKHPNPQAGAPLTWFINFMTERGVELKAGQAIITGSFCGIVETQFGSIEVEYQDIGQYQVSFNEKA